MEFYIAVCEGCSAGLEERELHLREGWPGRAAPSLRALPWLCRLCCAAGLSRGILHEWLKKKRGNRVITIVKKITHNG